MKKYLSLTRAGILESFQYRLALMVMVVGNLLYLLVIYYLWKAIYASAGTDVVNGMRFEDTLIYLVLATALYNFMEMYAVWEMSHSIQTGKIVLDLLKPVPYRRYLFWTFSGSFVVNFFATFLPTFVAVCLVTKGRIVFGMNIPLFVISVVMAMVINYCIDFFIGTICFYTESTWGINIMKQVIVLLLSGATIPLAFFPETLRTIVSCLPFQAIYNTPLMVLLNGNLSIETALRSMGIQLVWCGVLLLIDDIFWRISIRKIMVNGG